MNFCSQCGCKVSLRVPSGDNHHRYVCDNLKCGYIHYQNPKIITGTLTTYQDKVLLCKRAIEPRNGYWTLPAGFMENGETTQDGAIRETEEEANTNIDINSLRLYTILNVPHMNQVYIFYRAILVDINFYPGEESLEVELFEESDIPWKDLAFSAITDVLKLYFKDRRNHNFSFREMTTNPLERYGRCSHLASASIM